MKIAHIADLHVRGLSRHAEFRDIFTEFVEQLKDVAVDHILIAGDIFHTKTTGISPEYIDFLSWFLATLTDVAPVHIFLGNHDGTLANLSRQDAISPIVNTIKNRRIHVYKRSGVYQFDECFNWCVYSLFDKKGWDRVVPVPGNINIACYHGPVAGAHTADDWVIADGVKVEMFEKYDFAMLGDIHKMQHLATRESGGVQKPWISYPGSAIQQNYGEDIEHGWLLWDIKSRDDFDVTFKPLPNPYPYATIPWAGTVTKTLNACKQYPKKTRFRIRASHTLPQKEVQAVMSALSRDMVATEVTFKIDQQFDRNILAAGGTSLARADLRNIDVIVKLLKDFHNGVDVSENVWKDIHRQVQSYMSTVSIDDGVVRNTKWSLRHMSFDNVFTYGEGNVVDFDEMSGIVGIFGGNRIGKSSIVGTIMYALFNTTDRGPMKNLYVINVRKAHCLTRAIINVAGIDYAIERQSVRYENKKGQGATTALNVFKMEEDGTATDIAGEQRTDTERVIRKLIGSADDFLLTSLSAQGDVNLFITHGSARRKQIISKFLDLDVFDKMHDLVSKDVNIVAGQLRAYPDRNWDKLLGASRDKLSELQLDVTAKVTALSAAQDRLVSLQREYVNQKGSVPVTKQQVVEQRRVAELLANDLTSARSTHETCVHELAQIRVKIEKIVAVLGEHDLDELRKQRDACRTLESSVTMLKMDHEKELTALEQKQRAARILDDVPCGDKYPTCMFIKDAYTILPLLAPQKLKVEKSLERLKSAESALVVMNAANITSMISKLEALNDALTKLQLEESRKDVAILKSEALVKTLMESFDIASHRLEELELAAGEDNEIDALVVEIGALQKSIKQLDDEKMSLASQIGKVTSDIEKLEREREQREELLKKLRILELIQSAFSKKGIPSIIVSSQLPLINEEIAGILHGIVDFTVELEADDNTDSLEVYINYGDSRRIIELGSGMEKVISSLAIRVALINVSSLPKTDMFIIDEGFSALDEAGVEACNRLLMSLKRYFKTVIVITHIDGVKDAVDSIVEIVKNEKDSRVVYDHDKDE